MDNNYAVFKYLRKDDNDYLSKFTGRDLQDLFYYLSKYFLEYRSCLNIPMHATFGLEFEVERDDINFDLKSFMRKKYAIEGVKDDTLDEIFGIEFPTKVLKDDASSWEYVKNICTDLNKYAHIDYNCAGHIHIGCQVISKMEYFKKFLKLWSVYENIVFRFSYGEYLRERPYILDFSKYLKKELWNLLNKTSPVTDIFSFKDATKKRKMEALNFLNMEDLNEEKLENTIEIRCPNASLNPIIWQNNVNLFVKMLICCKNDDFDDFTLLRRHFINNETAKQSLEFYKEIYLTEALEFCDLVFNNNLDKVYFLRQYLKDFEIGDKPLQRAKIFTKS